MRPSDPIDPPPARARKVVFRVVAASVQPIAEPLVAIVLALLVGAVGITAFSGLAGWPFELRHRLARGRLQRPAGRSGKPKRPHVDARLRHAADTRWSGRGPGLQGRTVQHRRARPVPVRHCRGYGRGHDGGIDPELVHHGAASPRRRGAVRSRGRVHPGLPQGHVRGPRGRDHDHAQLRLRVRDLLGHQRAAGPAQRSPANHRRREQSERGPADPPWPGRAHQLRPGRPCRDPDRAVGGAGHVVPALSDDARVRDPSLPAQTPTRPAMAG